MAHSEVEDSPLGMAVQLLAEVCANNLSSRRGLHETTSKMEKQILRVWIGFNWLRIEYNDRIL
jgi:hypothetical protein